MTEHSAMKA